MWWDLAIYIFFFMLIYIVLCFYKEHIFPRTNWVQEVQGKRGRQCRRGLRYVQGWAPH